jgi:hypothetical protein
MAAKAASQPRLVTCRELAAAMLERLMDPLNIAVTA